MTKMLVKKLRQSDIPVHLKKGKYLLIGKPLTKAKLRRLSGVELSRIKPIVEKALKNPEDALVEDINFSQFGVFRPPWNFISIKFDRTTVRLHKETGYVDVIFDKNQMDSEYRPNPPNGQLIALIKRLEEMKKRI